MKLHSTVYSLQTIVIVQLEHDCLYKLKDNMMGKIQLKTFYNYFNLNKHFQVTKFI